MKALDNFNAWKLFSSILVSVYLFYCAASPLEWHFIDNVNLVIHEAGHAIFFVFGKLAHVAGGSALQVVIPLLFAGYFALRKEFHSAGIVLIWVGYSIINVSIYMNDAIAMALPLIGGDSAMHDWNYLFSELGLLPKTATIAAVTKAIGLNLMAFGTLVAVVWSFVPSVKKRDYI